VLARRLLHLQAQRRRAVFAHLVPLAELPRRLGQPVVGVRGLQLLDGAAVGVVGLLRLAQAHLAQRHVGQRLRAVRGVPGLGGELQRLREVALRKGRAKALAHCVQRLLRDRGHRATTDRNRRALHH
jgi:hypothetical protein